MERITNDINPLFDAYYSKIKNSDYDDYKISYIMHKLQTICKVTHSDDILKLIVEYANRNEPEEKMISSPKEKMISSPKEKMMDTSGCKSPIKIPNLDINHSVVRNKNSESNFSLKPESIMSIKKNIFEQRGIMNTDSPVSNLTPRLLTPKILSPRTKNVTSKYTFGIEGKMRLLPYNLESSDNTINFNLYNLPTQLRIMIYEYIKVVEKSLEFEIQKDMYKSWAGAMIQNNNH
jgi:hypothetical protein